MNEDRYPNSEVTDGDENPMVRNLVMTGLLAAGALYYFYRRSRPHQSIVDEIPAQGGQLVQRGQLVLENTLDHLSNQAMGEVKTILKETLHRLEQMVDDL